MQQNSNVRIITESINNKLEDLSNDSEYALPGSLADVRFTDKEISHSIGQVVDNMYNRDNYPITDSDLASTLKKKYYREAKDEGIHLSNTEKSEVDDLISEFKQRISDNIEVPYLSHAVDFLSTMSMVVLAIDVILILVFIFVLIYLARHFNSVYAMFHYVGISFMVSSILTFILVMIGYWIATSKQFIKAMGNFEIVADAFANSIFFDFIFAVLFTFALGFIVWAITPIKREALVNEIVDDNPDEEHKEVEKHNYEENREIEDSAFGNYNQNSERSENEDIETSKVEETTNESSSDGKPQIKTYKKKDK